MNILIWIIVIIACGVAGRSFIKKKRRWGDTPFVRRRKEWSIGMYVGKDPLALTPAPGIQNPVLTFKDVTDIQARFVADPFMYYDKHRWHMFFEVLGASPKLGCIGYATSLDGLAWRYEHIVLREPFHLSYPYVFASEDRMYMIPESRQASAVRLYCAAAFPDKWEFVKELVQGDYADPSIIYYKNKWWLFTVRGKGDLILHYADTLTGEWTQHPKSPLVANDKRTARPGGRIIEYNGKLVRYAQNNAAKYGSEDHAYEIDLLTPTDYHEQEISAGPVVAASGSGWNCNGMHTVDPHRIDETKWIACVDGLHVH